MELVTFLNAQGIADTAKLVHEDNRNGFVIRIDAMTDGRARGWDKRVTPTRENGYADGKRVFNTWEEASQWFTNLATAAILEAELSG